jgi:hypothetical protein
MDRQEDRETKRKSASLSFCFSVSVSAAPLWLGSIIERGDQDGKH